MDMYTHNTDNGHVHNTDNGYVHTALTMDMYTHSTDTGHVHNSIDNAYVQTQALALIIYVYKHRQQH